VGFEEKEISVRSNTSGLSVQLTTKSSALGDVVVIGYGTQKRKDLTGAVESINMKKTDEVPMVSVDQMLSGRAAGVQINQSSGNAGAGTSINIRGGNSLNGSNQPLFVIDGFPIINDNDAFAPPGPLGLTNAGSGNPGQGNSLGALNWLNPADIQSVEILKDASATAIYGSRGANGVIIITTKKAKPGQARMNFSYSTGVSGLNKSRIKLFNGEQYATYLNLANQKLGLPQYYIDTTVNGITYPTPDKIGQGTNWIDEVTRKGVTNNYSLGFAGGSDVLFSGNVSYLNQQTPFIGSDFKRGSFRLNLQTDLTPWLRLDNTSILSSSTTDNSPSDIRDVQKFGMFEAALMANAAEPAYNPDGTLNYLGTLAPSGSPAIAFSPISLGKDILNKTSVQTIVDNLSLKAKIVNGLSYELRGNVFSNSALRDIYYNSVTTFNGQQVGGLAGKNSNNSVSYLVENFLTYNKTLGVNALNAVGGYSYQQSTYKTIQSGASGFPNDILKNENLAAGQTQYPTATNKIVDLLSSYYIRLNDVILNKYILTFTARYDGSSKFGENNKWAFFPSGAISWKIKEEDFLKDSRTISDLKLRLSYGLTGNQAIQSLQSQTLLGFNNYPLGGVLQTGAYPAILGNPNLKWETTKQFNFGLDFGFFNQRLTGSINYYTKKTVDLLQQLSIPENSGYSSIYDNVGSISNKGIELALHGSVVNTRRFKWDIDVNLAHNKQILTDLGLPGSDTLLVPFNVVGGSPAYVSLIKGRPVGEFYGFVQDGIYNSNQEVNGSPHITGAQAGSIKFRDLNGDGVIDNNDRKVLGNPNPKIIYGINNSFTYQSFDLSVLIQGVYGGDIWNLSDYIMTRLGNRTSDALNYWTPTNAHATYAAPGDLIGIDNHSSFSVQSASYLKVKAVTLGYTVSNTRISFLKSARIYASAANLFTITGYKGFDPEINSFAQSNLFRNIDIMTVPVYKTYTIGLNVGF
jgi:TonB-linked SusC/RagA family outer membrane protein